MTTPQQRGRQFEREIAERLGAELVPGSGCFFSKLDVDAGSVLFSLKLTQLSCATVGRALFREADAAITAPGGVGGNYVPGVITGVEDGAEVYVTMRLDDFLSVLSGDVTLDRPREYHPVDTERRRASLLRDDGGTES